MVRCAGRVDDVINVSGHRIGTAEVESALVNHPACAEAAVVPVEHTIKGQGIYAFITLMDVRCKPHCLLLLVSPVVCFTYCSAQVSFCPIGKSCLRIHFVSSSETGPAVIAQRIQGGQGPA